MKIFSPPLIYERQALITLIYKLKKKNSKKTKHHFFFACAIFEISGVKIRKRPISLYLIGDMSRGVRMNREWYPSYVFSLHTPQIIETFVILSINVSNFGQFTNLFDNFGICNICQMIIIWLTKEFDPFCFCSSYIFLPSSFKWM